MNQNERKFGDRVDARRCNDIGGMSQILIDLKPKRSLSEVYINQKIDVTNLVKYIEKQKNNEQLLLSYIFTKGSVETDSELKVFLDNSESIYEDDICLVDAPDNIPRRVFFSDDNRFYCEIAGNKRWDEEMQIYRLYSAPEKVRFYSPDGEENSYLEVLKKMVAVYI